MTAKRYTWPDGRPLRGPFADAPTPSPDAEPVPTWEGLPATWGVPDVDRRIPGVTEAKQLPYGITAEERAAGISSFNPTAQETVSGERTETPADPGAAVRSGYDNRFTVGIRIDPQAGSIERVAPPSGLQRGEQAGLLPRANE